MRSCEEFASDLTEYVEGHMPVPNRMSMWLHMVICSSCRAYFRQMELVRSAAADLKSAQSEPSEEEVDALSEMFKSENP